MRPTRVWTGLLLLLSFPAALAGLDIDFGAAVPLGDDGRLFVNVSSRHFDVPVPVIERSMPRLRNPDDMAVALFLSKAAGQPLDVVVNARIGGAGWWDVGVRYGVPADTWFVPVPRAPGPPYGKAYGHWKKHRAEKHAMRLTDKEARDLVVVRVMHEYYGLPVDRAMAARARGTRVDRLVGREYRARHGKGKDPGKHDHGKGGKKQSDEDRGHDDHGKGRGGGHGKK